jgi:oxaloacetate decarboxylase alpha subunit
MSPVRRQSSTAKKGVVMNLKEIKELIEMLKGTDIAELEVERSGMKVRLRKGSAVPYHPATQRVELAPLANAAPATAGGPQALAEKGVEEPARTNLVTVTSPIVGTFYRSPAPEKPAYAQVGDVVKKGQVLCIVEAMKLMNEIESEQSGKIVQILVENGQPVEYGQDLFVIEPA